MAFTAAGSLPGSGFSAIAVDPAQDVLGRRELGASSCSARRRAAGAHASSSASITAIVERMTLPPFGLSPPTGSAGEEPRVANLWRMAHVRRRHLPPDLAMWQKAGRRTTMQTSGIATMGRQFLIAALAAGAGLLAAHRIGALAQPRDRAARREPGRCRRPRAPGAPPTFRASASGSCPRWGRGYTAGIPDRGFTASTTTARPGATTAAIAPTGSAATGIARAFDERCARRWR